MLDGQRDFRSLSLMVIMAFLVAGDAEVSHAFVFPDELVVYVGDRPYPSDFDPYYNQPKIYRQPRYYTSTREKDQHGRTVYKKTTSHRKKKKK